MGLDKLKALRVETTYRSKAGPRNTYIFKCAHTGCDREVRVRCDDLERHSSLCSTHSHVKRPFESIYNGVGKGGRGDHEVDLTYEEFLEFTQIKECHYCGDFIQWQPYGVVRGRYTSRAYFLDRKDNAKGYSKENCVVCCSQCNLIKSDHFTYEEMKAAMNAVMFLRRKT